MLWLHWHIFGVILIESNHFYKMNMVINSKTINKIEGDKLWKIS